jgi:autophagy-related protein 9
MAPSTPSREGHNSLLHLLNPYSSMARSTQPLPDPDSPSTLLLRELQGNSDVAHQASEDRSRLSLTPPNGRPTHVIATPSTSSDDEADGPPTSIMFGEQHQGDRTPKSSPTPIAPQHPFPASRTASGHSSSPGPFRLAEPSSSSASDSHSRSTSPGPSTISIYASGLEETGTGNLSVPVSSHDPSTSPDIRPASSSRRTPTFREPPHIARPSPPVRSASSSSKKASPRPQSQGYLDPPISSVDRKGKGKAKNQGGRRYQALPVNADDEEEDEALQYGAGARSIHKTGLNEYERALWRWVNVEDLDGFLQEVSSLRKLVPGVSWRWPRLTVIAGLRLL